jgi:ATP-dependent DNA ligase
LEVVRAGGKTRLYSRRQNVLNKKFHYIASALDYLPAGTVIDGELVAMGPDGHPDFNLLQNSRSAESHIQYYAFDILVHKNKDLTQLPLSKRREILHSVIKKSDHIDLSAVSDKGASEMMAFVKKQGLEGVVAKRADSVYQPGLSTGLWAKHRINLGQEFVIRGYTPGTHGFDALIVGFYRGRELIYAARHSTGLSMGCRELFMSTMPRSSTPKRWCAAARSMASVLTTVRPGDHTSEVT